MKRQVHSTELRKTIEKRRKHTKRLLIGVIIGVLILLLVPNLLFLLATKPTSELTSIELPEEIQKQYEARRAEKRYYSVYITEDDYLWMEGQYKDSAKINTLVADSISNWTPRISEESSILVIKVFPESRFESLTDLLDTLSQYSGMKYAIEEINNKEKQEIGLLK